MNAWTSRRGSIRLVGALLLLAVAMPATAGAQTKQSKEQLEAMYARKLELEFMNKVAWERSIKKAKERCFEANKPIYAYFTRSYSY